ncbi:glutathionylspermidine synthase family protein, partial [Escherichia coli]|nr:glutathionylspermidine synthase family protein [Escherichia coli]
MYPWGFMFLKMLSATLEEAGVRWLDSALKCISTCEGLLPLLWATFPNRPILLRAYLAEDDHPQMERRVMQPYHSLECPLVA